MEYSINAAVFPRGILKITAGILISNTLSFPFISVHSLIFNMARGNIMGKGNKKVIKKKVESDTSSTTTELEAYATDDEEDSATEDGTASTTSEDSVVSDDESEDDIEDSAEILAVLDEKSSKIRLKLLPTPKNNGLGISFSVGKNLQHQTKIVGRASVPRFDGQGDHVTSHTMIARGLKNAIDTFVIQGDSLPQDVRTARENFFKIISTITLFSSNTSNVLFENIEKIIRNYNNKRMKKTAINRHSELVNETLAKTGGLNDKEREELIRLDLALKKHFQIENCQNIVDTFRDMIQETLTFYNKLSNVSFKRVEGFIPPKNENALVKEACNYLSGRETKNRGLISDDIEESALDRIASSLTVLFFFPEVSMELAINEIGEKEAKKNKKQIEQRENENKYLPKLLARHFILVEACFPLIAELEQAEKDEILDEFVKTILNDAWPSYNLDNYTVPLHRKKAQTQRDKVINDVKKEIKEKNKAMADDTNSLKAHLAEEDLESSDDEITSKEERKKTLLHMFEREKNKANKTDLRIKTKDAESSQQVRMKPVTK